MKFTMYLINKPHKARGLIAISPVTNYAVWNCGNQEAWEVNCDIGRLGTASDGR